MNAGIKCERQLGEHMTHNSKEELEEKLYEIFWDGPFTIDELEEYAAEEPELAKYWSLYAKYEDHPIYGNNVLTYIGKAEKQDVLKRLKQHDLEREKIYVGIIYKFESWAKSNSNYEKDWAKHENVIKDATIISPIEELFIHALWPAGNLRNKNTAKNSWPFRIFNTGYKGSIPQEVSGHYTLENLPETLKQ